MLKELSGCYKDSHRQSLDVQNEKNNLELEQMPGLKVCRGQSLIEQGA